MTVICGFTWKTEGADHKHECGVVEHSDDWASDKHVCAECLAWIDCRQAARQDELRKEADANWKYYNPATDLLDIEELESRSTLPSPPDS